ncbi:MAG: prephenate dehydrogenase [Christensenellaceae bacterium]|nr:prephenate dehydrogenase [Christensenellaceae bacterium]
MKIAVIGIGLMGGSLCKAIKAHTEHRVAGIDTDPHSIARALACGAIDEAISPEELSDCDLSFICLFPEATVSFVSENACHFKKGSIVADICGVKEKIVDKIEPILSEKDLHYVPTHPMAGREFSGFTYADDSIFNGASFIITPTFNSDPIAISTVQQLALAIGFGRVVFSTAADHDRNIAFTSQLAHVVSNAYIKSPSLWNQSGFSAGSFLDLTRVAKLNEEMWSTLFLWNDKALLFELDTVMENIAKVRDAIAAGDRDTLRDLLKKGRIMKELSMMGAENDKK